MKVQMEQTFKRHRPAAWLKVAMLLSVVAIAGCQSTPRKPTYQIQVGWTKEQVLEDSQYRDMRKDVMTTSSASGTAEIWSFGDYGKAPYASVYFDRTGKVIRFTCFRYCE